MIQVAQNGDRPRDAHPSLPVTLEELVADASACLESGAASVHLHPRRPADGIQSLAAEVCDPVVAAIRSTLPGLEISLSTSSSSRSTAQLIGSRPSAPGARRPIL